ncbi:MAG: glycogen/starch synthase [Bacteroidales bacterium]|nr:glycogen/starch synthase [Bacteroidales bacterium]
MKSTKVLFISQEITPYLPESEMALIGRNLPQGIQEKGKEIRTFMPRYGCINERRNQLHEVIRLSGMNLVIDDTDHPLIIKVASIQSARMQVYFIDNEDYFHRKFTLYDEDKNFFEDNDERLIFFARGVLETVKKLRWAPDLIHCHGWISAFVPLLIKKGYSDDPLFAKSKVIYSIYNDEFNKSLRTSVRNKILIDGVTKKDVELLKTPDYLSLTKLAVNFSDGIIYGSPEINKDVDEYIKTINKIVLPYQAPEHYIESFNDFYDQILNNSIDGQKKN